MKEEGADQARHSDMNKSEAEQSGAKHLTDLLAIHSAFQSVAMDSRANVLRMEWNEEWPGAGFRTLDKKKPGALGAPGQHYVLLND